MPKSISVAEARARFSELVKRASRDGERFVIERRGKAVGAIVSAADLARLETEETAPPRQGLIAAVGALAEFEELDAILEEIQRQRAGAYDREINLK